ncbi:hypothetical protein PCAR4_570014 [Paraburkholderia caribensis]|nr:hypothetical protein PCAR4_570014 [Paraburkholderia caribensis]
MPGAADRTLLGFLCTQEFRTSACNFIRSSVELSTGNGERLGLFRQRYTKAEKNCLENWNKLRSRLLTTSE